MMKYANYIILLILLLSAFLLKDTLSISTNLLSLFAPKESVEKLNIATELGYTKELLIAIKGFDKSSQEKVEKIVKELKELDSVKSIQYTTAPSLELQKYYKDNYLLLSDFDTSNQDIHLIHKKLKEIQHEQLNSLFYTQIDINDPLKLFSMPQKSINISSKDKYITLGDYGYLVNVQTSVSPSQMTKAKIFYQEIKNITSKYTNVIAFAGFFYTVENSSKIKEDILFIGALSILILLIIYIIILKNGKILFHTLLVLSSSSIFALLVSLLFYDNFHVISLAFGISVTAVSIDYLFHYYFHGFYNKKKIIDRNVLYGFLTTLSAFVIFSFIPVVIISQISFFTVLSLSFSYFLFTFIFKSLDLKTYKQGSLYIKNYSFISSPFIFILSLSLLGYIFFNLKLDNNIRNLDYNNAQLREVENIFKDKQERGLTPVLVSALSKEELISNLHSLDKNQEYTFSLASFIEEKDVCEKRKEVLSSYDFTKLNKDINEEAVKLGFRQGYFSKTYSLASKIPSCDIVSLTPFEAYNLSITKKDDIFYSLAFVSDTGDIEQYNFVSYLNVKDMFSKVSKKMYEDIFVYSSVVFSIIIFLLFVSVRKRFFYALTYILFPLSITLSFLVTFFDINIMHIFGLIILIAIGIDYGIYMSNTKKRTDTMLAIKYSLISTFGAFGILIFSSITALYSIGLVITLGVLSILFLVKVMK